MSVVYSKQMLIERIKKHFNNGFPDTDFNVTENELLLYIDAAIPFALKSQVFDNAKISGNFEVPDAYLLTYQISLLQNTTTREWYGTLPQTPLALPSGYQITDAYFASPLSGKGQAVFFVSTKRISYRNLLPKPTGVFARIEGNKVYCTASNGMSLTGQDLYIQMPISRTASLTDVMN